MPAPDYRDQAARLAMLQQLRDAPAYTAPDYQLREALRGAGLVLSADAVRGHLAWLAEQGLLLLGGGHQITIPTLTERGADVASGAAQCPGVARPLPV